MDAPTTLRLRPPLPIQGPIPDGPQGPTPLPPKEELLGAAGVEQRKPGDAWKEGMGVTIDWFGPTQ